MHFCGISLSLLRLLVEKQQNLKIGNGMLLLSLVKFLTKVFGKDLRFGPTLLFSFSKTARELPALALKLSYETFCWRCIK